MLSDGSFNHEAFEDFLSIEIVEKFLNSFLEWPRWDIISFESWMCCLWLQVSFLLLFNLVLLSSWCSIFGLVLTMTSRGVIWASSSSNSFWWCAESGLVLTMTSSNWLEEWEGGGDFFWILRMMEGMGNEMTLQKKPLELILPYMNK